MPKHVSFLLLLVGCLSQMSATAGVMLCSRDSERPEIQIRFYEAAQVRLLKASSGHEVARFDSREGGTSRYWQAPEGARGCYSIELELAAAPGKEVFCLTNDEAIGYTQGAQAELVALIHYHGARLETHGTPCGTLPTQRSATAAPKPPPPAAANGGAPPAFAWPPPRPSTRRTLARHLLTGSAAAPTLEYVSGRLQAALEGNGYVEYSYYSVPGGFALATRLERIHPDGRSMAEPKRWQVAQEPLTRFDLTEYLRALFDAERGHFRVIVFIVTPAPLITGTESPSAAALAWPREGVPVLPDAMRPIPYGFGVELLINPTRYQVISALTAYHKKLGDNDNFLLYFAGHGTLLEGGAIVRGQWMPSDAERNNPANWISNVEITDHVSIFPAKQVLVIADSCYSGALTRSAMARIESDTSDQDRQHWLKLMATKRSRTVLTSGGLAPVLDSGGGKHSVFAQAMLDVLAANTDVLETQRLYREVAARVAHAADRYRFEQVPEYAPIRFAGHEAGDFFFVPR